MILISGCATSKPYSFEEATKEVLEPLDCDLKRKLARCVYIHERSEEDCKAELVNEESKKECKENKY